MTEPERLKEWSHRDEWHGNYSSKGDLLHKSDENKSGCFWGLVKFIVVIIVLIIVLIAIIGLIYLMRNNG